MNTKSNRSFFIFRGIAVLFIILPSFSLNASGQSTFKGFSINPKAGGYGDGFTGGMELGFFSGNTIYSVDYFQSGEFTLMDPVPADEFNQIGFMIGKYIDFNFIRVTYQGGIGPFFGKMRTESISGEPGTPSYRYYEEDKFFTPGVVAKFGLKLIPFRYFSLGVDVQTNLNLKRSLFFPCLSLEFGLLKSRNNN